MKEGTTDRTNYLEQIICNQLSSVTFVHDYVQLNFNGPILNAYNPLTVKTETLTSTSSDVDFKNIICKQISKTVDTIKITEHIEVLIVFKDNTSISISLKNIDYIGPEAISFYGLNNKIMVI